MSCGRENLAKLSRSAGGAYEGLMWYCTVLLCQHMPSFGKRALLPPAPAQSPPSCAPAPPPAAPTRQVWEGCASHFIVGRGHAGPGKNSQDEDFIYSPYDA